MVLRTQDSTSGYLYFYFRKLTRLLQFSNVIDFSKGVIDRVYELPFRCGGTGHVVFNNSFYCHGFKSARIFKYDLKTRIANETRLPGRKNTKLLLQILMCNISITTCLSYGFCIQHKNTYKTKYLG